MIRLVFLLRSLACGYYCLEKLLDFDVQHVPQLAFLHEQISTEKNKINCYFIRHLNLLNISYKVVSTQLFDISVQCGVQTVLFAPNI